MKMHNGSFVVAPFFGTNTVHFLLLWLLAIFFTCFVLFFTLHPHTGYIVHGERQIPTLSMTGAYYPGSIIFTLGLHVAAVYVAYVFTAVYVAYEGKFDDIAEDAVTVPAVNPNLACVCKSEVKDKASLRKWNLRMLRVGLTSATLMGLVGSVSLKTSFSLHSVLAFLMFACAVVHMVAFYNNIHRYTGVSAWRIKLHHLAVFICIPFNVMAYLVAGVVVLTCDSDVCWRFAVDLMPVVEFTTVVALAIYVVQFHEDIKDTRLLVVNFKGRGPAESAAASDASLSGEGKHEIGHYNGKSKLLDSIL